MQSRFTFQPFTAAFARDPYSVYARMREACPVYYHKDWDMYLLSTYDDICTLVNDRRLVRTLDHVMTEAELSARREAENWESTPNISRYVRVNILDSEGEVHDRLRQLVFRAFTPVSISTLRSFVQKCVDQQLDSVVDRHRMDFIEDFVAPIPGLVIGRILGVPESEHARLRSWSEQIVRFFEPERSDAEVEVAECAAAEFADYLTLLAGRRHASPREDLISELLAAEDRGALDRDELLSTCMIILMAGHGSTIDVAGTGMLALLRHPGQMALLREQASLVPGAVQEMLRYDSPLPFFHRLLLEDMHYKDFAFKKGTRFGILYGSANRDPACFNDPDRFDITRRPNRHLAFGIGSHFCLGNHLARLNMDIMFTTVLSRIPGITLAEDRPEFRVGLSSRGLKRLPVSW